MATNNLLNQPAPEYRSFVDNQVLTDDQLNSILNHLNYQDQLSRVLLSGVGIVCGLKITYADSDKTIHLSKGVAITTAGNLMKVEETKFSGFKKFNDSEVKYGPFTKSDDSTIPLWELETDTSPSDVDSLTKFESKTGFSVDEAIAVLYLEDYLEEDEDCSSVDCNTQGKEVVNTVRVLLVNASDIENLLSNDSIITGLSKDEHSIGAYLPALYSQRVVLTPANTTTYSKFINAYDISFNELHKNIEKLASLPLFNKDYSEAGTSLKKKVKKSIEQVAFNQYIYDLYKDLTDAYNELRIMLVDEYSLCCPDPEAFPKHVLLGKVTEPVNTWRHRFYPSPAHQDSNSLARMKKAFQRILHLIEMFEPEKQESIIVTPSRKDDVRLGKRAIPFYYNLEKSEHSAAFIRHWKENGAEWIPNYFKAGYPKTEGFDPLDICMAGHDFYRVEGHLGNDIRETQKRVQEIRKEKGLAFDVVPVAIGNEADAGTIDFRKYRSYFEDLQVVLDAWNEEQDCVAGAVTDFLSKFSTQNVGEHKDYPVAKAQDVVEAADVEIANLSIAEKKKKEETDATDETKWITPFRKRKKRDENAVTLLKIEENAKYVTSGSAQPDDEQQFLTLEGFKKGTVVGDEVYGGGSNINYPIDITGKVYDSQGYMGVNMKDMLSSGAAGGKYFVDFIGDIGSILININSDIRKLAVIAPVKLVGLLADVLQASPKNIDAFTTENLADYITAMDMLCEEAKATKKFLESKSRDTKSEVSSKPWLDAYSDILNRILVNCCITNKIKVLYEKVLERKNELLSQFVLDQYIGKHPGAEHKAGVTQGGTLILLYLSEESSRKKGRREIFSHMETISSTGNSAKGVPGTVVGDLCLPYICCSDTPSTTFIFPETPASLRLPTNFVCMPDDGTVNEIPITVRPADGSVKAFVGQRELTNVIVEKTGESFFDPNKVAESDYGKGIRFTVNDQVVNPIITLYEKPKPVFSYNFDPAKNLNADHTEATVVIKNESTPFDKLSFEWDLDGEIINNDRTMQFTHTFNVEPGKNYDIPVSLTASNGPCVVTVDTQTINMDVPVLNEEPDGNCQEVTVKNIKTALELMEAEISANPNELHQEFQEFYNKQLKPAYDSIISEPKAAFAGDKDAEVFKFIQDTHFEIGEGLSNQDSDIQREFILKVYYELILLYFYMHACRDGQIDIASEISDVAGDWPAFNKQVIEEAPEALKMLLEEDAILDKLTAIRNKLQSRFSDRITSIVNEIIERLTEFDA